jgi:pyruvate/2-oxoglutarate dehydrogenase complex dihydrolipoamide acyltransferase (E2) component
VPVGELLVVIGSEDGGPGNPPSAVTEPMQSRVQATPAVRRLAAELGVDLAALAGDGPVTEAAVRAAAGGAEGGRREPLRGVRRAIAEHLARSHREVPAVTVVEECDFTHLSLTRGELSYLPFVLRATADALGRHPALNARLDRDEIVYLDDVHLGVAMQTEAGLMVPVVRDAAAKSVEELAAEVSALGGAAAAGSLTPEQLRGSTFTVSSAGRLGGLFATPLVNHPEVAILGVHRIAPRPVVIDGAILVRDIGLVSCTFDHRVVDGAVASAFLLDVIAGLEGHAPYRPAAGAGAPAARFVRSSGSAHVQRTKPCCAVPWMFVNEPPAMTWLLVLRIANAPWTLFPIGFQLVRLPVAWFSARNLRRPVFVLHRSGLPVPVPPTQ